MERVSEIRVPHFRVPVSNAKRGNEGAAGDIFLCYLTGVMRWVGALGVVRPTNDQSTIWSDEVFPVRFEVSPIVALDPEHGVPMEELEGKVLFYSAAKDRGKFKGFVRMSPNRFADPKDGELILSLLKKAQTTPIARPVDPKKLARKPLYTAEQRRGKTTIATKVSVPESDEPYEQISKPQVPTEAESTATKRHSELQYNLLTLGGTWVLISGWPATTALKNGRAKLLVSCRACFLNCPLSSTKRPTAPSS